MPPRGVKKGTKRARQYEKIKRSQKRRGSSERRAKEIAAQDRSKGAGASRRVEAALANLDPGHLVGAPRRPALGQRRAHGARPVSSSTTRPRG